jgi:hypothetical protein
VDAPGPTFSSQGKMTGFTSVTRTQHALPSIHWSLLLSPPSPVATDHNIAMEVEVFDRGSTLGNLLRFVRGQDQTSRMLAYKVRNTTFLVRRERSPTELIPGVRRYATHSPRPTPLGARCGRLCLPPAANSPRLWWARPARPLRSGRVHQTTTHEQQRHGPSIHRQGRNMYIIIFTSFGSRPHILPLQRQPYIPMRVEEGSISGVTVEPTSPGIRPLWWGTGTVPQPGLHTRGSTLGLWNAPVFVLDFLYLRLPYIQRTCISFLLRDM